MKNTTAFFFFRQMGKVRYLQLFKDVHMEMENILMKFFIQKKQSSSKINNMLARALS